MPVEREYITQPSESSVQQTGGQPTPAAVEAALREDGQVARWRRIEPEPRPAPKVEYRLSFRDAQLGPYVSAQREVNGRWWLYVTLSGGLFVESDEPPLAEAVDAAIQRVTQFLDFLREEQARLRSVPMRDTEAPDPALIDGETA